MTTYKPTLRDEGLFTAIYAYAKRNRMTMTQAVHVLLKKALMKPSS